jgi:putative ABC transport system ATP-binding protein
LKIDKGEFVAVIGKSGSGKTTLINMITGIDKPSSGAINIGGVPVHTLREGPMAEWRGRNVGVIFVRKEFPEAAERCRGMVADLLHTVS